MDGAKAATILTSEQILQLITQSQDFRTEYFNHARVATTYTDLRIFFGDHSLTAQGQQSFVEQLCIVMSPEFAKTLSDLLVTILNQYEGMFGKIRPSPGSAAVQTTLPLEVKENKQ